MDRDIYYNDTNLFESQSVVDAIIAKISKSWNVPRSSLNVVEAAKGLVAGDGIEVFYPGRQMVLSQVL